MMTSGQSMELSLEHAAKGMLTWEYVSEFDIVALDGIQDGKD